MLDVTTNQNINCMSSAFASSSLEDDMDPLFDNDWLHEHNLDVLFDLFEEEVERKGADNSTNYHHHHYHHNPNSSNQTAANSNSSTIFGTSPVTSYLFGTSPSLAIDLYDLLYLDNQQQSANFTPQQQSTTTPITITPNTTTTTSSNKSSNLPQNPTTTITASNSNTSNNNLFNQNATIQHHHNVNNSQRVSQNVTTNHIANSITNAMRIKKRLKRGKSEGISLLARPLTTNNSHSSSGQAVTYQNSSYKHNSSANNIDIKLDKNNSDKTSVKQLNNLNISSMTPSTIQTTTTSTSTNFDRSCTGGIDINYTKQQGHYSRKQTHHHTTLSRTGCAVIREHAYAVRGH